MGGVAGEDGDLLFLTAWSGHVPHSPHSGHPPTPLYCISGQTSVANFYKDKKVCWNKKIIKSNIDSKPTNKVVYIS